MSYLEKFYNILQGYVCCPLTLDDVNPHWSVDVVRYGAGVVTLVHGAGLPHNLNLHIQQTQKLTRRFLNKKG